MKAKVVSVTAMPPLWLGVFLLALFAMPQAGAVSKNGQNLASLLEDFNGDGIRILQVVPGPVDSSTTPEYGFYILGALQGTTGVIWNGQRFEAVTDEDDADLPESNDDFAIRPIAFVAQMNLTGEINWLRFIVAYHDDDLTDSSYTVNNGTFFTETEDWTRNPLGDYFPTSLPNRLGGMSISETYGIVVAVNCMSFTRLYGSDADFDNVQYSEDYSDNATLTFMGSNALYVDDGSTSSSIRTNTFTSSVENLGVILDFDGNATGKFSLTGAQDFDSGSTIYAPTWITDVFFDDDGEIYFTGFTDFVGGTNQYFLVNSGDFKLSGSMSSTMLSDELSSYDIENEDDENTVSFNSDTVDYRTQGFMGKLDALGSQDSSDTFVNAINEYLVYDSSASPYQPFANSTEDDYSDLTDVTYLWGMPLRITEDSDNVFIVAGMPFRGIADRAIGTSSRTYTNPYDFYSEGGIQFLTLFQTDSSLSNGDGEITHTGGRATDGSNFDCYDVGLAAENIHPGDLVASGDRIYLPISQETTGYFFTIADGDSSYGEAHLFGGVICFGNGEDDAYYLGDFLSDPDETSGNSVRAASLYAWQYDDSLSAPYQLALNRMVAYGPEPDSEVWDEGRGQTVGVTIDDEGNLFWSNAFQFNSASNGDSGGAWVWNPLDLANQSSGTPEILNDLTPLAESTDTFTTYSDVETEFFIGALDTDLNWITSVGLDDGGYIEFPDSTFIEATITSDQEVYLIGRLDEDNSVKINGPATTNSDVTYDNTSTGVTEAYNAFYTWDYDSDSDTYALTGVTGYSIFLDVPSYIDEDWLDPSDVGIEDAIQPIAGTTVLREGEKIALGLPYRLYFDIDGNLTHRADKPGDASTADLDNDDRRIRFTFDALALVGDSSTAEQGTNYLQFTLDEDATITVDYLDEYLTVWSVVGYPSSDWDLYDSGTQFALPEPDPSEQTYYMERDSTSTPSVTGAVSAPTSDNNGIITGARYVVTSFMSEMYEIRQGLELLGGNEEIILGDSDVYASTDVFTFQIRFEDWAFVDGSYNVLLSLGDGDFKISAYQDGTTDTVTYYLEEGNFISSIEASTFTDGMLTFVVDSTTSTDNVVIYYQDDSDDTVETLGTDSQFYQDFSSNISSSNAVVSDTGVDVTADDSYTLTALNAVISQIRIWDIALTEDEVSTYGSSVPTGTEDDLVGAWYFSRNEGSTEEDLTDNDNAAILADFSQAGPYVSIVSSDPTTSTITPTSYSSSSLAMDSYSNTGPVDLSVEMQKQFELVVSSTEFEGLPSVMPVVWTFDSEPTLPDDLLTTDPATNDDGYTGIGTYWVNDDDYVVVGCFQQSGDGSALQGWSNASGIGVDSTEDKAVSLSDALSASTPLINTLSSSLSVDLILNDDDGATDLTFNTGSGSNDEDAGIYYNGDFYYFDAKEITQEITIQWTMDNPVFYFTNDEDPTDTDASFIIGEKLYPFDVTTDGIRNQVAYTDSSGNSTTDYILYVFYSAVGIDAAYYDGSDSTKSIEYRIINTSNDEPSFELISAIKSSSTAGSILGWNYAEQALVAMQPGTVEVAWDIEITTYDNGVANTAVDRTMSIEVEVLDPTDSTYSDFYDGSYITMALDAGNALLDPEDADAYMFYDSVYWSGSDLTSSSVEESAQDGDELVVPYEGYTVLRFLTTSDGTVPRGDLVNEEWEILIIKSEQLSADSIDSSNPYLVKFTFGDDDVDVVDAYVGQKLSSLNSSGTDQDLAGIDTGKLMETSQYGYLAPINAGIYSTTSEEAAEPGLPKGNIIPVNTVEYASNGATSSADLLPYQVIVVWYDGGDSFYGAYVPANPLQYDISYPDVTDCNGFITVSSALGSQSLYGDGTYQGDTSNEKYATLPTSDFPNTSIYYQEDSSAQGFNPNEEHALITDKNSNDDENDYTDEDGDAVFALRTDLNITSDNQGDYTGTPELTSEAYVLVNYYDSDEEEFDMLIYKVYKETAPDDSSITDSDTDSFTDIGFDLVGYTAGTQISPPYPLTEVVGLTTVPDFYQPDDSAPYTPYWEDVNGDYWTIAGESDFYGFFFYPMTGSFYYPDLDGDGSADYSNGDVLAWFPTSLTESIPDYESGDDLGETYAEEIDTNGSADWAPVQWTLESEWPDNVAVLKIGETLAYSGGDFSDNNSFYPTLPTIDYDTEGTVDDDDDSYGRFTLYKDESDANNGETSVTLAYDATASEIEDAVQTIYNGTDVVDVTGDFPVWTITFTESTDSQADLYITPYTSDTSNLTSDADFTMESAVITEGGFTNEVQAIYLSGIEDSDYWAITTTQDDSTNVSVSLPLNATATQVQVALNDMNTSSGPFGTGTVTVTGESPAYTVTWDDTGEQGYLLEGDYPDNDYPISFVSVSQSVAGDSSTAEVQTITLTAQAVDSLPEVIEWEYGEIVFDELNPDGDSFTSLTDAYEKSTVRFVDMFDTISVDIVDEDGSDATFSDSVTGDDEVFSNFTGTGNDSYEFFYMFPSSLQTRVAYDPDNNQLTISGLINGESANSTSFDDLEATINYIQPNILSGNDLNELYESVEDDDTWQSDTNSTDVMKATLESLYYASRNPNGVFTSAVGQAPEVQSGDDASLDVDAYSWLVGLEDADGDGEVELESLDSTGGAVTTNFAYLVQQLTAGDFSGSYVVLAENNNEDAGGASVDLEVIYVAPELVTGSIVTIEPNDAFVQKLTLRMSEDFGANDSYYDFDSDAVTDLVSFDWIYKLPDSDDDGYPQPPDDLDSDAEDWTLLSSETSQEINLENNTALLLTDYWFYARYTYTDTDSGNEEESLWAGSANSETSDGLYVPQLATGWVNRVLDAINYFENRYTDFVSTDAPEAWSSIVQQAGAPYDGDVTLSDDQDTIEDVGLIEFYTTLYNYAYDLADDAGVVGDVSDALLNAAHRVAFLYYLLGNEAYADAVDPMIGVISQAENPVFPTAGSNPNSTGLSNIALPPTAHAFEEMVIDLNQEELALLRGLALSEPDDPTTDQPSTGVYPVHNRLYWNMTGGIGQMAYTLTYAPQDFGFDGFLDADDAETQYPQGHGDAWGHYLSAVDVYYDLLAIDNFSWNYDAQAFSLDDVVIELYYWNERRFAQTAAARVQAGIDILQRTFKDYYSDGSEGQWVGYEDTNSYRAWGVEGWAKRVGQAAYFDWLTANALVPAAPAPEGGSFTLNYDGLITDDITVGDEATVDGETTYSMYDLDTIAQSIEDALNDIDVLGTDAVSVEATSDASGALMTFKITWAEAADTAVLQADTSGLAQDSYATITEETEGSADDGTASVQIITIQQDERVFGTVSRSTVEDLADLASLGTYVQSYLDRINGGLNALGVSPHTVPFDIDPSSVYEAGTDSYTSHYEQLYDRALESLRLAFRMYALANVYKANLRTVERSTAQLRLAIINKETELLSVLKQSFGTPYTGTIGDGKLYDSGYSGPDYYLYNYVDNDVVNDYVTPLPSDAIVDFVGSFPIDLSETSGLDGTDSGNADTTLASVFGHYFTSDGTTARDLDFPSDGTDDLSGDTQIASLEDALNMSFDGNLINLPLTASDYASVAPDSWGQREYYGTIQMALTKMVQAEGGLRVGIKNYQNLVDTIESKITLIQARYDLYEDELTIIKGDQKDAVTAQTTAQELKAAAAAVSLVGDAMGKVAQGIADSTVQIVGFSVDSGEVARIIAVVLNAVSFIPAKFEAAVLNGVAGGFDVSATNQFYQVEKSKFEKAYPYELQVQLQGLEQLLNEEPKLRYEIFNQIESLRAAQQEYLAEEASALSNWSTRIGWNRKFAEATQKHKTQDMAFRIQRNAVLAQYREAFELAQRYVYLAAKAYDYETSLDPGDPQYAGPILDQIANTSFLGMLSSGSSGQVDVNFGSPVYGQGGLAHALAWLDYNFSQIQAQNGHNQPGLEVLDFSLREELAGIEKTASDADDQAVDDYSWLSWLVSSDNSTFYDDLRDSEYYNLYCREWNTDGEAVPGFIITFSSTVTPGEDFFGNDLDGGDSAYDPTRFATRIYSAAVQFENYDTSELSETPRCYLIPTGVDISRVPDSLTTELRSWNVVEQKLPVALPPTDADLEDATYSPVIDGLDGYFGELRQHSAFPALTYTPSTDFDSDALVSETRLVGRSVWNTEWALIIPLESMHYKDYTGDDPTEGSAYKYFLPNISGAIVTGDSYATDGITDIILHFQTYSFSGN